MAKGQERELLTQAIQKCIPQIQDRKIRTKWQGIVAKSGAQEGSQLLTVDDEKLSGEQKKPYVKKVKNIRH